MTNRIEKYLTDKMNAAEKALFEQELIGNSDLEKEVNESRIALDVIRAEGRARLKERLINLDKQEGSNSLKKKQTMPWFLALLALILTASLFFWYNREEFKDKSAIEPILETESKSTENIPVVQDSVIISKEPVVEQKTPKRTIISPKKKEIPQKNIESSPPIAKEESRAAKNNRLFAQSFTPYRHPSLRPNVRGAGDLSNREKFELAYWEEDYSQVIKLWDSLSETQQNNGNLLFLKAIATMEEGRVEAAAQDFQQLLKLKKHRFVQQSEWYLVLAVLRENNIIKAKELLLKISENANHPRNQQAIDLLKEIK